VGSIGGRGRFESRGASLDRGASIASGRLPSIITDRKKEPKILQAEPKSSKSELELEKGKKK
jgi:hypothetical protein